jgi:membrane protein involved in colicin uptake
MASVFSLSSVSQSGLQQARRNADQAASYARSLRAQADDAQNVADQAEAEARAQHIQASQAQTQEGQAQQTVAALTAQAALAESMSAVHQAAGEAATAQKITSTVRTAGASPVVNMLGQVTGAIINVTA